MTIQKHKQLSTNRSAAISMVLLQIEPKIKAKGSSYINSITQTTTTTNRFSIELLKHQTKIKINKYKIGENMETRLSTVKRPEQTLEFRK